MSSMLKNHNAKVIRKEIWGNDYCLLSFKAPEIAKESRPGQFLMVRVSQSPYPLLRRPFSIHSKKGQNLEIFFQNTGIGTSILSEKQLGEEMEVLGPLGNGFHIQENYGQKTICLIGGGRGIAPLYFLALELIKKKQSVKVFFGANSSKDLRISSKFKKENIEILCSTEDGSSGYRGLVTDLFKKEMDLMIPSFIYACGPQGMLKKISEFSKALSITAQLSLESIMGCGFGACWGCVKKIKKGKTTEWRKICEDGPVFFSDEVVWD